MIARALMPSSTVRSTRSGIRLIPSSMLYSVWLCRWVNMDLSLLSRLFVSGVGASEGVMRDSRRFYGRGR